MKISVIQMNCGDDREKNLDEARDMVGRAVADDRPDMVVLPETFAVIGGSLELRRRMAEPLPNPDTDEQGGPAYECLRGLAAEHGIFVHGGSFMERAGDDIYNTTVAFDRLGGELARYRKIHRFDVTTPDGAQYRESDLIAGGAQRSDHRLHRGYPGQARHRGFRDERRALHRAVPHLPGPAGAC